MATSGGQPDNKNAQEGRRWREAIKRALARHGGDINKGLDALASRLINQALAGKPWAIDHIAERIDGKAVMHVDIQKTVTRQSYAERLAAESAATVETPAGTALENTIQ